MSNGRPVTIQCAITFASTTAGKGNGNNINCSRLPSCKSSRNSRSSASKDESNAATQIMPGAIRASGAARTDTERKKGNDNQEEPQRVGDFGAMAKRHAQLKTENAPEHHAAPVCVSEMRRILLSATLSGWWVVRITIPLLRMLRHTLGQTIDAVNVNRGKGSSSIHNVARVSHRRAKATRRCCPAES